MVERKGLGRSIQERGLAGREKRTGEIYTGEVSLVESKGLSRSIQEIGQAGRERSAQDRRNVGTQR